MAIPYLRIVKNALVVVVVLAAGLGLGSQLAQELKARKLRAIESENRARQVNQVSSILKEMNSIHIGDTLPDLTFEDLSGHPVRLSEKVLSPTWLAVIEPTCETCIQNARRVKSLTNTSASSSRFIFMSCFNPLEMQDLQDSLASDSPFLNDSQRHWCDKYRINAFPFQMLVDQTLQIKDIVIGDLSEDQIRRVL